MPDLAAFSEEAGHCRTIAVPPTLRRSQASTSDLTLNVPGVYWGAWGPDYDGISR
jgi:hypothetical protein